MTTSQLWTAPDYAPFISGSGADKLADSGVAPLVAAARGMRTILPDDVKTFCSYLGLSGNTKQAKQIKSAVSTTDALYMPWYRAEQVANMQRDGEHRPSNVPQFRPNPANLVYDAKGKAPKYVNILGATLIIGPHPAYPADWFQAKGMPHMFTEGMLKADSAITSMLLANGVTAAQLSIMASDIAGTEEMTNVVTCRNRLQALMETIPESDRILIYGFVSVTTWKNNPEWNAVDMRGVDCYVAYDGDTAVNPKVWKQAHDLFDFLEYKKAHPKLIDMKAEELPNGEKCGMDDYLAKVGDWAGLLKLATSKLPPKPEGDEAKPGDWRMNAKTRICEQFMAGREEEDPGTWLPKHDFVARVAVVEDRRAVSDEEMRSGVYSARTDARDMDSRVEVEIEWFDNGDDPQEGTVCGPHDILMAPPSEWRRIQGATTPSSVAFLESWPPREPEFLKAMKGSRRDDVSIRPLWTHMGWVPSRDGNPVFLVGNQVIGPTGEAPKAAATSVTGKEVQSALKFGVQLADAGFDEEVRSAVRRVLGAYRPSGEDMNNGPFQNRKHASIVLAAGLRPCAPSNCTAPIILTGSTSAGKSWASAAMMMFWQSLPGTWTNKSLPGSANDTFASSEVAISKTPIWVLDDLAPSEDDPTGTGRKADAVWTLVRNVANHASRGRRTSDMRAQELHVPRAQLIVSAEKTPETNQSIMNRVIHIKVRTGEFLNASREPTNAIDLMGRTDCPQSLITGYVLQMLARRVALRGWPALLNDIAEEKALHHAEALQVMTAKVAAAGADPSRQADTAADLALGLTMLSWAIDELGMMDEFGDDLVEMRTDLYEVARDGYNQSREIVLGKQFVADMRSLLRSHKVHIASCGAAGVPMSSGEELWHKQSEWVNDALGWEPGDEKQPPRAGGERIGDLVYDSNKVPCILFDTKAAFGAVQKNSAGWRTHSSNEVWDSVVVHGFRHEKEQGGWAVKSSGGHAGLYQRVTQDGRMFTGVAIPLEKVLDALAVDVAAAQMPAPNPVAEAA